MGASLAKEDIYGLRDVRANAPAGDAWEATWKQNNASYRLWMATPCDVVEASNGPGQRTPSEVGRRVRYVDAIRRGDDGLSSHFLAVHESRAGEAPFQIQAVSRIPVDAGPNATALKVEVSGGAYYALNDFDTDAEAENIRFRGQFALVWRPAAGEAKCLAVGAGMLEIDGKSVAGGSPRWRSAASTRNQVTLVAAEAAPAEWQFAPRQSPGVRARGDGWRLDRVPNCRHRRDSGAGGTLSGPADIPTRHTIRGLQIESSRSWPRVALRHATTEQKTIR